MFIKISKHIPTIFFGVFIILFSYVLYRDLIVFNGEKNDDYIKYYGICVIFLLISIISYFLDSNTNINLILIFFSILLTLYIIEFTMLHISNIKYGKIPKKKINRVELYNQLKDKDYVLYVSPSNFVNKPSLLELYPLSGISNKNTIWCNENGYEVFYKSDRYGFINSDEDWDKNEIDYLIVGDSFGRSSCVKKEESISENLKKLGINTVINLSNSGTGPLTQYATLKEYLSTIKKVNNIIWIYFEGNDFYNLSMELKNKNLLKYLNDDTFNQSLSNKQKMIDKNLNLFMKQKIDEYNNKFQFDFLNTFKNYIKLQNVRKFTIEKIKLKKKNTLIPKEFELILKLVKNLSVNKGAKLYFVYLPDLSRYEGKIDQKNYLGYEKVLNLVDSLKIDIIDLNQLLFTKIDNPISLRPYLGAHFNKEGYKLVSEKIYNIVN